MSYAKQGYFGWAGGGKNGATVDLWATSRFAGFPAENQAPPSGSPDAGPVTTADGSGGPGAYYISGIATAEDYYVRVQYGGNTYWGACPVGSLVGYSGGGGAVSSVSNSDGTLTISPTTGAVVASRAALTGDATASAGSNAVTVVKLNGTSLAGLATGLLKITTGTGVPSSVAAPVGTVVGTTDTQTLTNKTLTSPAVTGMSGTETNVTPINNAVSVTSNAGTVPVTSKLSTFTNSSAAAMTITIATASAVDGQPLILRIYDFSAVAETITFVNTENSTASVPSTSNGSTTLPLTVGFMYNAATSKWRCVAVS